MTPEMYVAVAGPIAVGKTTLAQRLAERWGWLLVREPFERNPFLPEFYRERALGGKVPLPNPLPAGGERGECAGVALATELYFLWSRFEQLRTVPPLGEAARGPVVTDYDFAKGLLFASLTLGADERAQYRRLFDLLAPMVRPPDLVVYLTDTTDHLLERIHHRARPMEQALTADYIAPLREAYERSLRRSSARVITIDCARVDPASEESLRGIEAAVGA